MMGSFDIMSDAPRKIVIYRLEDGANLDRIWFPAFGGSDRGYFWISDYRAFLKRALLPMLVKPCP
jgi:hypothetical protein